MPVRFGGRGKAGLCPYPYLSPGLNGAKIRPVWDGSRPERVVGVEPGCSPEPPTQAGSLCYIALLSVERSFEMLPGGSSVRPH